MIVTYIGSEGYSVSQHLAPGDELADEALDIVSVRLESKDVPGLIRHPAWFFDVLLRRFRTYPK